MIRSSVAPLVVASVLALVACSATTTPVTPPTLPVGPVTGKEVAETGKLIVSADNCVMVQHQDGSTLSVTWPPGYTIKSDKSGWIIVDGQSSVKATVGDTVHLGGGQETVTDTIPGCPGAKSTFLIGTVV